MRRNFALEALVERAAAVTRVGVMVQVGSGVVCAAGIEQDAVCVLVRRITDTACPVLVTVPWVLVTVVVVLAGVTVVVGD